MFEITAGFSWSCPVLPNSCRLPTCTVCLTPLLVCGANNALAHTHAWRPDLGKHLPDLYYVPSFRYLEIYGNVIFPVADRPNE
jgi:hypothetical protein